MISGVQVNMQSNVRTCGGQCSLTVREIGIQCSIPEPPTIASQYLPTSSPIPSDSSQSEFDRQEITDHDTSSAYTLGDDLFS